MPATMSGHMEIAPVMPIHPHTSKPNAPTKFKKKRALTHRTNYPPMFNVSSRSQLPSEHNQGKFDPSSRPGTAGK